MGWTVEDDDPVKQQFDEALVAMQAICCPVLQTRPT